MAVLDHVSDALTTARQQADRFVPPQTRQEAYDAVRGFAQQRPLLFSFLAAQLLLALLPLALFVSFAAGVVATAAVAAMLFSLFWVGLAALALAAALSVSFGVAVLAWAWGVGTYLVVSFGWAFVFGDRRGEVTVRKGKSKTLGKGNWGEDDDDEETKVVKREEDEGHGPYTNGAGHVNGEDGDAGVVNGVEGH